MLFRILLLTLLLYLSEADESETHSFPPRIARAILSRSNLQDAVGGGSPGKDFPALSSVPRTDFDCRGRLPGYYANEKYGCQVFHVCHSDRRKDSFLCPNGTIFHQQRLICDWWYNVDCASSHLHENVNADIGRSSVSTSGPSQQSPRPSHPSIHKQQQTSRGISQRPQTPTVHHQNKHQTFVSTRPKPSHPFVQHSPKTNSQPVSHRFELGAEPRVVEKTNQNNEAIFVKKPVPARAKPASKPQHQQISRTPSFRHKEVKINKRPVTRFPEVEEKTEITQIGVPLPSVKRRPVQTTQPQRPRVGAGRISKNNFRTTSGLGINNVLSPPRKPSNRPTTTTNFVNRHVHTTPVPQQIFLKEEFPEITTHHPSLSDHLVIDPSPPKRVVIQQTPHKQSFRPQISTSNFASGQRGGRISPSTSRRPSLSASRRTPQPGNRRTSSRKSSVTPTRENTRNTPTFGLRTIQRSDRDRVVIGSKNPSRVSTLRRPLQTPRHGTFTNNERDGQRRTTSTGFRTQTQITRPNKGRVVITKRPLKRINRPLHFDIDLNDLDDFNDPFDDDRFDPFDDDRFDRFNDDHFDDDRFDDDRFDDDRFDDDRFDDDRFDDDRFDDDRFDDDRFDDDRFDDDRFDDDRFDDDRFDDDRFDDDRFDNDRFDDDRFDDDRFDDDRFDNDPFDDDYFDDDRIFTSSRRKKLFKVDIDDRVNRFGNVGKFNFGRRTRGSRFSIDTHKSPSEKDSRVFVMKPPPEIQLPPPLPEI